MGLRVAVNGFGRGYSTRVRDLIRLIGRTL